MSGVTLDWSTAEVRHDRLEVLLRDNPPDGWKETFHRTLALLGGGDVGNVKLKKRRVRMHDVAEGNEDRLRHLLESVVAQANATHEQQEGEASNNPGAKVGKPDGLDAEMTERFRSFAE
ncbi:MAG TPA: hypothetical protein VGI50_16950 [Solirubrobacteraceae bacterium]